MSRWRDKALSAPNARPTVTGGHNRQRVPGAALAVSAILCVAACTPATAQDIAPALPRETTSTTPRAGTPGPGPQRVVVIGDSLSTGYGTSPEEAWPRQLDQEPQPGQKPMEVTNAAADGAGYVTAGEGGETFGSEIAKAVNASTDIVVLFGSDNDAGQDPADLKAAVADALATSKTLAPRAARIVIGPLTAFGQAEPDLEVIRDQERAAAREAGAEFIDPVMAQWIDSPDSALLGPDGEHPSSQGQQFLKAKIRDVLVTRQNAGAVPASPSASVCQDVSGHARPGLSFRDCKRFS